MLNRLSPREVADQKFRDADSWRFAFDICASRYQAWVLVWIMRRHAFRECMRTRRVTDQQLMHLSMMIDEAHDLALTELENMRASARNADHAELAGRIYYEEYQGI